MKTLTVPLKKSARSSTSETLDAVFIICTDSVFILSLGACAHQLSRTFRSNANEVLVDDSSITYLNKPKTFGRINHGSTSEM